jgi:chromosome segregation ATPase
MEKLETILQEYKHRLMYHHLREIRRNKPIFFREKHLKMFEQLVEDFEIANSNVAALLEENEKTEKKIGNLERIIKEEKEKAPKIINHINQLEAEIKGNEDVISCLNTALSNYEKTVGNLEKEADKWKNLYNDMVSKIKELVKPTE